MKQPSSIQKGILPIALIMFSFGSIGYSSSKSQFLNSETYYYTYNDGLQDKLKEIAGKYNFPAVGAAGFTSSSIKDIGVYGVRKQGDPTLATVEDKFHLGSCGKAMTATLVAKLIEQGKLSWSLTLKEAFPDLKVHPKYSDVTIEMLLAHQGGVTSKDTTFEDGVLWKKIRDQNLNVTDGRKIVASEVLQVEPEVEPNTKRNYSNFGYTVVGAIIDKVTGESYESALKKQVFEPLGMNSCGFGAAGNPLAKIPDQPWPHKNQEDTVVPLKPDFFADNPATVAPIGTMHCSMKDWIKFLQEHLKGHKGESSYLTKASFKKLHTAYNNSDYSSGGWGVHGYKLAHMGSNTLNFAIANLDLEKDEGYITVSNYIKSLKDGAWAAWQTMEWLKKQSDESK